MTEESDREVRILGSLTKDVSLWEAALTFPADCFSPIGGDLFLLMREHYIKYGVAITDEAIHDKVKRANLEKETKKELLRLYYSSRGTHAIATQWDLDFLREATGKNKLLSSMSNAVRALTEGVEIKGKYYVGLEGAAALLDQSKAEVVREKSLTPFEVYQKRKEKAYAIPSPLFDPLVTELMYGEFWILGGYAGDGKTTASLNLAYGASLAAKSKTLYITMETPRHVAKWKMVSIMSNQNMPILRYKLIRGGKLDANQEKHFQVLLEKSDEFFKVVEMPVGSQVGEVKAVIRTEMLKKHYDLIVLDYLGLMGSKAGSEYPGAYMNEAIKRLKEVPKQHSTVFVCVHQMNREGHKEAVKTGYYTLNALSDANEAEKSPDGIAWVLKLGFCRTKLGIMKYRDEPLDLERVVELQLEPETHTFTKTITAGLGAVGRPTGKGWDGQSDLDV